MKRLLAIAVLASMPVLAGADDFPLTGENTKIAFVGTKPGGKHDGGFKTLTGSASVAANDPTSLKLSVDIDTTSLYADNDKLTTHLKSPDFFGVKSNPKAKFVTTKVEKSGDDYKITGNLTLVGQTKAVTFPAKVISAGGTLSIESSFTIDRTQWGMTYGKGKINDDVKLTVSVKAKK